MRRITLLLLISALASPLHGRPALTGAELDRFSRMNEVSRTETLALHVHPDTAEVAVHDLRTDTVWFSNPPGRFSDSIANPLNVSRLSSQLVAFLYSPSDQEVVLDTTTNAVDKGQFSIEQTNGVLRVTYRMDNFERGEEDIPMVVGEQRFQQIFLENVNAEERELLLERFTYRPEEGVYRRFPLPAFLVSEFVAIMDKVGYTARDLEFDNEANAAILARLDPETYDTSLQLRTLGPVDTGRASVTVVIEYRLVGDELVVRVPAGEILEDPVYPLNAVRVLPFFGAAGPREEGYIVLPDGAGTLIHLNNGKTRYRPFQLQLYGADVIGERRERRTSSEQAFLPVYGIKRGEQALAVEVAAGAAIGELNADIAGRLHSYNWVGVDFQVRPRGRITIGSGFQETSKLVFQSERFTGTIELRYGFLYGTQASYLGIADWYRGKLEARRSASLEPPDLSVQHPTVELIGGVQKRRSLLGVVVPYTEVATDFEQAYQILEQLASFGITGVAVRYRGWFNDDIEHDYPSRIRVPRALGGSRGFQDFLDAADDFAARIYPDVYFAGVFGRGNGFSPRRDAARFIDQTVARAFRYNVATYQVDPRYPPSFYLSPARIGALVEQFLEGYESFQNPTISLADLGRSLTSDFDKDALIDRGEAERMVVSALERIRGRTRGVMIDGANAYALPYANYVTNVPVGSNRFQISDEEVPFVPLVLRGLVRYAYEPINRADDLKRHFLETLVGGAELGLLWTWADASVFRDTPFDHFYSTGYAEWMDEAVEYYQELADFRRVVGNRPITAHERVGDQLYSVRYGEDLELLVNYGSRASTYDGISVEAKSYKLRRLEEVERGT
jgi:hypothetical protein